jgi:hypothetical protein
MLRRLSMLLSDGPESALVSSFLSPGILHSCFTEKTKNYFAIKLSSRTGSLDDLSMRRSLRHDAPHRRARLSPQPAFGRFNVSMI